MRAPPPLPSLPAEQTTKEKVAIKKITKNHLQPHDHDALKSEVALLKECAGQANVLAYKDFFEEVKPPPPKSARCARAYSQTHACTHTVY